MNILSAKRVAWVTGALVIGVVSGVFFHHARFSVFGEPLPFQAVVEQVIDGDTVILDGGEMVRYLGINAPEVRIWDGNKWVLRPQVFGKEAMSHNEMLVKGKRVHLEYDQRKRDKYNRLLAYVSVGEVFVNGELVKQGMALMDVRTPNLKYQKKFLDLQKEARHFQRGVWRKIADNTASHKDAHKYIGKIGVVEGEIVGVHLGKERLYLNFGRDFKKDFTCIIYRENLNNFLKTNNNPTRQFFEKKVRVYGFIKNINGPAIIICAPSQMDIVH